MDKVSVTSPIDSLKNGFEAVYGGMGGAILENLGKYKIQKFQKGHRGGMMCCQIMAETSSSLGAARYQLSIKVNRPYLSYVLYLNMI